MSNYSLANVFTQEPGRVKTAILAVLATLVITGVVTVSVQGAAAIGVAVEALLDLFYVRPLTVSTRSLGELKTTKKR